MKIMYLGVLLIFLGVGCLSGQIYYDWLSAIINREALGETSYSLIAGILGYISAGLLISGMVLLPLSLRSKAKQMPNKPAQKTSHQHNSSTMH